MNKYPQYIPITIDYFWSCGDRYATIKMSPYNMEFLDEPGKSILMDDVNLFIGTHEHEFVQVESKSDDTIIFICDKGKRVE